MNDLEINGIAQGMMMYLMQQTKYTADAHAVLICLALHYYDRARAPDTPYPIEEFAKDFASSMVHFWNERQNIPTGTIQ